MLEIVIRYFHFLGIGTLAAVLVSQNVLLTSTIEKPVFKRLLKLDALYGLSAAITLGTGLALWLWLGKPASFYSANSLFIIKVSLFALIGGISLIPTFFIVRNRHLSAEHLTIPNYVFYIKRAELILLIALPLLAVLMAKGVGLA